MENVSQLQKVSLNFKQSHIVFLYVTLSETFGHCVVFVQFREYHYFKIIIYHLDFHT